MKTLLRRAAPVLLAAVLGIPIMPRASALENESFGLTPHPERTDGKDRRTFSIPLEPGSTFEDAVRVYNRTDQTLKLLVYAADAEAMTDGTITVGFKTGRPEGVGRWIDLAREDVELDPRDEVVVTFRVTVKSAEPSPELGAIVVENTEMGLASNVAQRLHVVVLTTPPNTQTTSVRVRPLLLRSPWIAVALFGLVVAGALVWVGARRARRPKDVVVPVGELDVLGSTIGATQESSLPVIKRLGAVEGGPLSTKEEVLERARARTRTRDDRPLIDDALLVEVDPGDDGELEDDLEIPAPEDDEEAVAPDDEVDDLPPARPQPRKPAARKPAARKAAPPAKKSVARKKTVPKAKPAPKKTRAVKKSPPRKRTAKKEPARNYIPLSDL